MATLSDAEAEAVKRLWVAKGIVAALAGAFCSLCASAAWAGAVDLGDFNLAESRVPTWYTAPDGGIPDTAAWTVYDLSDAADMTSLGCTTVDLGVNSGPEDVDATNCAINAAPAQSVLFLPPGRLDVPNKESIEFGAGNDEKVLRCASNTLSRIVMLEGAEEGDTFSPCWGSRNAFLGICSQVDPSGEVAWTAGFSAGTTTVTVADASGFSVGDWVYLEQDDDDAALACPVVGQQNGDENWATIHKISGKSGNDLTFERPLRNDWNSTNRVVKLFTAIEYVGVENCSFEMTTVYNNERTSAIHAVNAANVWVTGNRIKFFPQKAITVKDAARVLIRGNHFQDSVIDGAGPQQILLNTGATDTVVESNVFDDADPLKIEQGASGSVIAYNFWIGGDTRGPFLHGNATETLVEGNHSDKQFAADNFWCSQGPRNTLFRNRFVAQESRCWSTGLDWDDGAVCTSDSDCPNPQLCYDEEGSGIVTHGDRGHANQISPQMNVVANMATHLIGRPACGDNAVTEGTCRSFDAIASLPDVWIERNRTRGVIRLDDDAISTTEMDNRENDPAAAPAAWKTFAGPDSLYLPSRPEWWCQEACPFDLVDGIGAFGDDLERANEGRLCKLPAQIRYEGGTCTPNSLPTP